MSYTHSHQANTTHPAGVAPSHASSGVMPPSTSFQPSSGPQPAALYATSETGQHSSFSSSSSPVNQGQQAGASALAPRTTSLPFAWQMGSSQSKSSAPVPPPAPSSSSTTPSTPSSSKVAAASGPGGKLKRAFARRRKDAEPSPPAPSPKGKEPEVKVKSASSVLSLPLDRTAKSLPSLASAPRSSPPRVQSPPTHVAPASPIPRTVPSSPSQHATTHAPPPLPKKDTPVPLPSTDVRPATEARAAGNRTSIMPISPGISSAVTYISMMEQQQGATSPGEGDKENAKAEGNKESWRKSDSTNSHRTVRQGGPKSSRPDSWAESFQSSHTVVQSSRRRSALVGDADFGPPEEDDEDELPPTQSPSSSPPAGRNRNRRSMSLNIDMSATTKFVMTPPPPGAPVPDLKHASLSISEGVIPVPQRGHAPSLSDSQPYVEPQPPRFMAADPYAGSFPSTQLPPHAKNLQYAKPPPSSFLTAPTPASAPSSFRQTAISIGVGPAAAGLAKRAVEKMGRKWGMSSSTSGSGAWSTASGSSSTTNGAPSSYTGSSHMGEALVRTSSNQSTPSVHSFFSHSSNKCPTGKHGRTAGTAGSISSGVSSDPDFFAQPTGPLLGRKLRGALRSKNGVQVTGVVFGRDLATGVRETGIHVGKMPGAVLPRKAGLLGEFEERCLAAIVVRCAQHLLTWGVQEEGLFRLTGRPAHVSKLRAEFDSGADYDMVDCSPGDLDPHAVSSVFKAYLRELPEPILTHRLQPLFDAAVNQETKVNAPENSPSARQSTMMMRGQGLPSNPKAGLRKPPSLSTLAMPSFHGIPPASKALQATLRGLIKQLPAENRDLIRTVVDLIKETSKVKETKMPVSNLLVVFCPSLNLSPPLLKVLCEADGIWGEEIGGLDGEDEDVRKTIIAPVPSHAKEDDARSDTTGSTAESDSLLSVRPSLDDPSDYHASAEDSIYEGKVVQRPQDEKYERAEVPTVYLDSRSQYTSSSASFPNEEVLAPGRPAYMRAEDTSSITSDSYSVSGLQSTSPPLLSSSANSIATPLTSSNPSTTDLPVLPSEDAHVFSEKRSPTRPEIVTSPVEMHPQDKRPKISEPIPVPNQVAFPVSPKLAPVAVRRRSIPLLSSFSLSTSPQPENVPAESPAPSPKSLVPQEQRAKKPSLKLLFSKKSTSSLSSLIERSSSVKPQISGPLPAGYSPKPGSDSSLSTPISAVTAPQSSFPGSGSSTNLPHVIDTPIDESALSLTFGLDIGHPPTASSRKEASSTANTPVQTASASSRVHLPEIKPLSVNPKKTIKPGENHLRPKASTSNMSVASAAESHRLSLFEDDEDERMENWTQSVLLAADATGGWKIQNPASTGANATV